MMFTLHGTIILLLLYPWHSIAFRIAPVKHSPPQTTTTSLSSSSGVIKCRAIGIGSASPKTVITNFDLESLVETNDEWIRTRTGISSRHILQHTNEFGAEGTMVSVKPESLRSLSHEAAKKALEMANVDPKDLDLVICATSSAEDMFGDATVIASELGCTTSTVAFDLTAACSGFLFGAVTAGKFIAHGKENQKALVIGADALSRWVDWDDRNTCILFGDGAGAMVLESCSSEGEAGILGYAAHSNGNGYGDLNCGYHGAANHLSVKDLTVSTGGYGRLSMNGKEVYKFATREVPEVLQEAMDEANVKIEDVDWLLLHQANIRIMETVAKRLGIPMSKVITNLSEYGNTSAASIPLALDEAVRSGQVKPGDIIACAGFGAGLSWGAAIIKWG